MGAIDRLLNTVRDAEEFERGEAICAEGGRGHLMFLVIEGDVALRIAGHERERVSRGGVFGEEVLLGASVYAASAVAVSAASLAPVGRARLAVEADRHPTLLAELHELWRRRRSRRGAGCGYLLRFRGRTDAASSRES